MNRYYFDHNATTPVAPEALEAMLPALTEAFGNASSIHHFGQAARQRLDEARGRLAGVLGASPEEIVFTSGGTESDNLAVLGHAHVVTTTIEHPAVLQAVSKLASWTCVEVGPSGIVDPDDVRKAIRPETALISVMHANNELGTIQPIEELAKLGVPVHSDGVQAFGKIPVNVDALGVAMYSLSGHKIGAPKGVGALYVRKGTKLRARQFGGRHERERRAGTENVPGILALAAAARLPNEMERIGALRDRLEQAVLGRIAGAHVNGARSPRVPNTTNIRFDGIDSDALLIALDLRGFAVSSGAACSSGAPEPSHVLRAIGLTREQVRSSIRFSLGRINTVEQVDALVEALAESVAHLRKLSPAYV